MNISKCTGQLLNINELLTNCPLRNNCKRYQDHIFTKVNAKEVTLSWYIDAKYENKQCELFVKIDEQNKRETKGK